MENAFETAMGNQDGLETPQQRMRKIMADYKILEEMEKLYLPKLEEINRKMISIASTFETTIKNQGQPATPQQIELMVNNCKEYEKMFMTFDETAQYLNKEGRPLLLKRLNEILKDHHGATGIYQQMYQSKSAHDAEITRIKQVADQTTIDTIRGVTNRRQKASDLAHEQWTRTFNGPPYLAYCQHCDIKVYYYNTLGSVYCPICYRKLY